MTRRFPRLARFARREAGTASIEFVVAFPVMLFIFIAAFESGLFMARYVMLDRALDMMVRDLRLGLIANPTMTNLKQEVCNHSVLIGECEDVLRLELTPIDTGTWAFPTTAVGCVDRSATVAPVLETPDVGGENQMMLVRACATMDMLFPTTGIGLSMPQDGAGGYYVVAQSGFVNEP
jgi:Flp pilus assembly protein TadG